MNLVESLCEKLMMSEDELWKFVLTMPRRYKKYYIRKRKTGTFRLIAQPSQEAKFIQRILVESLREVLVVHPAAMAYEKGVGIKLNAQQHADSKYLLKMDFAEFFPSITPSLFFFAAKKCGIEFSYADSRLLENALFWKKTRRAILRLSIGAPSSPFISNFVMHHFDQKMSEFCVVNGINYTRYADDLTFTSSEKGVLFQLPKLVVEYLKQNSVGRIKVNAAKTVFSSKAFNRHVTGVVITNDSKLSIGRKRKREISSMIHKFSLSQLDDVEALRLKGLIAFSLHIEPDFLGRMKKKYSSEIIDSVMSRVSN